jgi:exopolyphosphatase/guanosine-5'-triphosphate,3'-diphosphate pyrophosphatase
MFGGWVSLGARSVIRAAIDVGSGGPKLRIAEIDASAHKIVRILHVQQYPVIFQNCLSGESRMLSPEIMSQGIKAIEEAIAVARALHAERIVIIGTSPFRYAANGQEFAERIQEKTRIAVHIVDQDLEGKLAFQGALTKSDVCAEDLIVWDIGGGSTQFIAASKEGSYWIDTSREGSGKFRDFIIESLQCKSVKENKSPNPLSRQDARLAEGYARKLACQIDPALQKKACAASTKVVGVGSVFNRGMAWVGKKSLTLEEIAAIAEQLIGKTDEALGGGDFACIEASNTLLILGFMKGLGIRQVHICDVNNAEGAMLYQPFWETNQ